jgi:hypothetical protein
VGRVDEVIKGIPRDTKTVCAVYPKVGEVVVLGKCRRGTHFDVSDRSLHSFDQRETRPLTVAE